MTEYKPLPEPRLFEVRSLTSLYRWYVMDLREKICTCKNFIYWGSCKHLKALKQFKPITS